MSGSSDDVTFAHVVDAIRTRNATSSLLSLCVLPVLLETVRILLLFFDKRICSLYRLQDILIGIITSKCPLLNYLLLIAKVYLWDCRRSKTLPNIIGLKLKVKNKYETEKYICIKNNTIEKFTRKWALTSGSVLQ